MSIPHSGHRKRTETLSRSNPTTDTQKTTMQASMSLKHRTGRATQSLNTQDRSQRENGTVTAKRAVPPGSLMDVVQRSLSTPCPIQTIGGYNENAQDHATRSISLSCSMNVERAKTQELRNGGPTPNGVSTFYSSKDKEVSIPIGCDTPSQWTNSQKIRRFFSFQGREGTLPSANIVRTYTVRTIRPLLKLIPFSRLMRSTSLENADFIESMKQLQATRDAMDDAAMRKHWFRAGRLSASSRSTVMRTAFPALKCSSCPRIFWGIDRKQRHARHCKKVHGQSSLLVDAEEQDCETYEGHFNPPARSEVVLSVDEFLLDPSVRNTYEANPSDVLKKLGPLNIGPGAQPTSKTFPDSHDSTVRWRHTDSCSNATYEERSVQLLSEDSTASLAVDLASDAGDTHSDEDYVPWVRDRIKTTVMAPIMETEELGETTPSTVRCSYCGVTYNGLYREGFLARHIFATHSDPDDLAITMAADRGFPDADFWSKDPSVSNRQREILHSVSSRQGLFASSRQDSFAESSPLSIACNREHAATTTFALSVCSTCGENFAGRYAKGLLARHKKEKHYGIIKPIRKDCLLCGHTFHRTSTRDEHEWREHLL